MFGLCEFTFLLVSCYSIVIEPSNYESKYKNLPGWLLLLSDKQTRISFFLSQSLTDIGECVILGQTSSTSESNQIELPDDINNYKLLILMYLSTDGDILNTNIVPIKYFKQTKYRVIAIWTNTSLGAFAKYIDDTHINLYVRTQYSAVLIGVK